MKKVIVLLMVCILPALAWAHCQMPCGIYDDTARIMAISENITTIEKAMNQISTLSNKDDAQSLNQIIRWVDTKDTHAQKIQDIVSNYFLTQRIIAKQAKDKDYSKYVSQTIILQQILVSAMKCKQTIDLDHATTTRLLLDKFVDLYFDDHGKKHLKELEG